MQELCAWLVAWLWWRRARDVMKKQGCSTSASLLTSMLSSRNLAKISSVEIVFGSALKTKQAQQAKHQRVHMHVQITVQPQPKPQPQAKTSPSR